MNENAKNLAIGNYEAFEEFTGFEDSDYDSSDCEDEPVAPVGPGLKPPPKSDKNYDVKPKESFKLDNVY